MNLRLTLASLGAAALYSLAAAAPAADPARPNVVFIFADDQRADTIAALGNPVIRTPHLDRLVHRGVAFNRAYMQGGLNAATCIPSRAMLLSGQSLFRIDEQLLRDETWPAAFGRAGYRTFISGKWHNGTASLPKAFQGGGALFIGGMGNPMQVPLWDLTEGKLVPQPANTPPRHACERMADAVIRFIQGPHDRPFFCYLPFDAPHDPHIVPDDFPVRYVSGTTPLPPNFLPQHPIDNGEMTIRDEQLLPWPRPPEAVRAMIADYYRYISYLDAQIGRVLDALEKSPHAKNTLVVFAADSGVARGSHGLIGKQNLYEHSVRVPLVISGPGIAANRSTEAMCYLFDVLPTLGKWCHVAAPAGSEGREFTAVLRDVAASARPHLMFAYKNVQRAVAQGNFKLIRYPFANRTQLFDLQLDPYEERNLAEQPAHGAKVAELTALLQQDMERFGDLAPLQVGSVTDGSPKAGPPPKK